MALRKVTRGQPLRIPADDYNAFVDAAVDYNLRSQQGALFSGAETNRSHLMLVKNGTSKTVPRFGILRVSDVVITPSVNEDEFMNRPVFVGQAPTSARDNFIVAFQSIEPGEIGPCWSVGVCPVRIDIKDTVHELASAIPMETGHLASSVSGSMQILWKQTSGTGVQWAVGRFGGSGGGASTSLRAAKVHSTEADSLRVLPWDPSTSEFRNDQAFYVAKPWDLQKTPWNGQVWGGVLYNYNYLDNQRRSAEGQGFIDEIQTVIPRYLFGQIIYWSETDYTGVVDPTDASSLLTRIDVNLGGRAWAWIGEL